ncbi:hypothetical protein FACS1894176_04140 [Bacteroidia bacterium]|nr:hypothetical protein FACS1894176_04140 [Bacteroidia bacterium]
MKKLYSILLLVSFCIGISHAQESDTYTLSTDINSLSINQENGYDILDLLDANFTNEIVGDVIL